MKSMAGLPLWILIASFLTLSAQAQAGEKLCPPLNPSTGIARAINWVARSLTVYRPSSITATVLTSKMR